MSRRIIRTKNAVQRKRRLTFVVGLVGGAIALVVFLVVANSWLPQPSLAATVRANREWGDAGARVTIEEFADFQCPVCARANAVLHQLAARYIETGQVRIVYRHFAFIGAESRWASQAAECAGEQNRFWDYANYLFTHQAGENVGAFSMSNLKQFGTQLGLETTAFNACLDSGKYANVVEKDTSEGRTRGVRATPSFFINGQFIEGLPTADQFAALIEARRTQ